MRLFVITKNQAMMIDLGVRGFPLVMTCFFFLTECLDLDLRQGKKSRQVNGRRVRSKYECLSLVHTYRNSAMKNGFHSK